MSVFDHSLLENRGYREIKPGVWAKRQEEGKPDSGPAVRIMPGATGGGGTRKGAGAGARAGGGGTAAPGAAGVCAAELEHGDAGKRRGAPGVYGEGAARFAVRVVSFRARCIDDDNLCEKFVVDGLRYAGLIPDDRHSAARITTHQEACARSEERTEIVIERLA